MKYKLKIYTVLLLICIFTMTLLSGCSSPYDKITEEDEKKILFYVYVHPSPVHENDTSVSLLADNVGNIYKWYSDKKLVEAIESNEVFECEIVGQVSADEVIDAYSNLCKIDEELFFYSTHEPEGEEERCVSYYGIRYMEGEAEIMRLGDDHTYTENSHAEEIVDFLETWDWREYSGIYW